MIYQCPKCGLSKSNGVMNSILPQCKCDWGAPAAQRTWVGLTDEERDAMIGATDLSGTYYYDDLYAVILLAEGKLKEKNT